MKEMYRKEGMNGRERESGG